MFADLDLVKHNSNSANKNMFNVNQENVSIQTFIINTVTSWNELIKLNFNQVNTFNYCSYENLEHVSLSREAFSKPPMRAFLTRDL